jgi:histidyl-tRNA synthetase
MGIERALLALEAAGGKAAFEPDAFVVHSGETAELEGWKIAERLRDAGLKVVLGSGGSFKSQLKKADASGARFAVILGDDEVSARKVTVKPLRGEGEQRTVSVPEAIEQIR